jgi:hypothetical protein
MPYTCAAPTTPVMPWRGCWPFALRPCDGKRSILEKPMLYIRDHHPDVDLYEIEPTEARIRSLVARNLHTCESFDKNVSIVGSLRIIDGLSSHRGNFKRLCVELESYFKRHRDYVVALSTGEHIADIQKPDLATSDEALLLDGVHHETVKYFNRMGQFCYFERKLGGVSLLPHRSSLMAFREKHTAHRTIDTPGGDTVDDGRLQAISMASTILSKRIPIAALNHGNKVLRFSFDDDHPMIIEEAYLVDSFIFYFCGYHLELRCTRPASAGFTSCCRRVIAIVQKIRRPWGGNLQGSVLLPRGGVAGGHGFSP